MFKHTSLKSKWYAFTFHRTIYIYLSGVVNTNICLYSLKKAGIVNINFACCSTGNIILYCKKETNERKVQLCTVSCIKKGAILLMQINIKACNT